MKDIIVDEKVVRKRMIDLDIKSISELAVKSGVSKPTIYDYLNGKTPFSTAFIHLCDFLELNPKDVLVQAEEKLEGSNV